MLSQSQHNTHFQSPHVYFHNMRGNPFQRLVSLKGPASAVSKVCRASTCDAALLHSKMPQSQPMQRGSESQLSDCESEGTISPSSDEELIFESASSTACSSSSPLPLHIPPEGLHSPLRPTDPALFRKWYFAYISHITGVAEILTESVITFEDASFFTPSPDEYYVLNNQYTDDEQCTVLAVHSLLKRASLPVDTFILAALILRRLTPEFYDEWYGITSRCQPFPAYNDEQTKEVVIVAAIVHTYSSSKLMIDYCSEIPSRCNLYINHMVHYCVRDPRRFTQR